MSSRSRHMPKSGSSLKLPAACAASASMRTVTWASAGMASWRRQPSGNSVTFTCSNTTAFMLRGPALAIGLGEHGFQDFHHGALLGLGQGAQTFQLLLQLRGGSAL